MPPIAKNRYEMGTFSECGIMEIAPKPTITDAITIGLFVHWMKTSKCCFTNVPI